MVNDIQSHLDTKYHEQTYPPKNVAQIIVFDENQLHDVHIIGLFKPVTHFWRFRLQWFEDKVIQMHLIMQHLFHSITGVFYLSSILSMGAMLYKHWETEAFCNNVILSGVLDDNPPITDSTGQGTVEWRPWGQLGGS